MADWHVFRGTRSPSTEITRLPDPPPWRRPGASTAELGSTWQALPEQIEMVNAALYLRRPLLVTGHPGAGKTSLAHAVAFELGLGEVLKWPVNSRSTLDDGLYVYDAMGRLRDVTVDADSAERIENYLRLGPLGTAFALSRASPRQPRVLLIDEIDKADVDFPNDLLHVLETGTFEIPELVRDRKGEHQLRTIHPDEGARVVDGVVRAEEFPVVFVTSNGERDLSPAFLRRCIRLDVRLPDRNRLVQIVEAHLGTLAEADRAEIERSLALYEQHVRENRLVATDQLMNVVFLVTRGEVDGLGAVDSKLRDALLRELTT